MDSKLALAQETQGASERKQLREERDKERGAAGSDLVPHLFTLYETDFVKGRILKKPRTIDG